MSSNIMKIIPDLTLPAGICQTNMHQVESSNEDVSIVFMAPISGYGTCDLNSPDGICQTNTHQMKFSDEDAYVKFMAPVSGDGTTTD